tara:strand:- start:146 stop:946 length:801 start_codon:yes stop_codon:yes gene_type:complete
MSSLHGALIYGNGESRKVWDTTRDYVGFTTWGCNAAYRDCKVDNLVAIDYGIQQEIYQSGYAFENSCWFADWSILEQFHPDYLKMNYPPEIVFETKKYESDVCVVQGKEAADAERNYQEMMERFPHLDENDVKEKCYKNVGLYITWLQKKDKIENVQYPKGWCAGATAMYLACMKGEKNIYMLGFDLSNYGEPLNNMYKGTDNYLPEDAKGFNVDNWLIQLIKIFQHFPDKQFYWVDDYSSENKLQIKNLTTINYKELDKVCQGLV